MTADHTPERLSAEIERALWAHRYRGEWDPTSLPGQIIAREAQVVVGVLTAHLADVEARLAAVEALTERLGTDTHDCFKPWCPQCSVIKRERQIRDMLRAALPPRPEVAASRSPSEGFKKENRHMTKPANPNPGYPPSDPKNPVTLSNGVKVWMTDTEEVQYGKGASRGKDGSWASRTDRVEVEGP